MILVLNGCNEPYYGPIMRYADQQGDLSLQCIQTDIGGVSNARNIGIEK